jgi:hypothetical protein
MNAKVFNLALMVFWLALFVGLLTRDWWMPQDLLDRVSSPQTPLVIMLAGMLAAWNLMRFYVARRPSSPTQPSPVVEQYRRRIRSISGEDPRVTDPQFQFDDPPDGKR